VNRTRLVLAIDEIDDGLHPYPMDVLLGWFVDGT
jgi:AAA15 family ATPase/GTPase